MIAITDPDDARIADYRDVRERDLTGRQGRFIVEGRVTLDILLRRRPDLVLSVLIGQSRFEPLADILANLPEGVPLYSASQPVLDAIAGFPLHRGVLALARKPDARSVDALVRTPGPQLFLALIGLSNHDNVGACFRNAAAFGASGVLLDAASCDPFYRKAIRVSAGTVLWLPMAFAPDWQALHAALTAAGHACLALTPARDAPSLTEWLGSAPQATVCSPETHPLPILWRPRITLFLGAEGPGLPPDALEAIPQCRIPMASGVDSLNVATAAAVALSHITAGLSP